MNILTVSPKGQITIPRKIRELIKTDRQEASLNFSDLAATSFEFWDNKQDDIYQTFYQQA